MNKVTVVKRKEIPRYSETHRVYDFANWNPSSRWKKLFKKLVEKVLSKDLSAMYMSRTVECTYHTIDTDSVLDQINISRLELTKAHHEAGHILVGVDEMHKLKMELEQHLTFTAPYYYNAELFGVKITVVPWMKGVVVVPKGVL